MPTVTNSVTLVHKFCAAHRLIHHPGKCSNLHGHNYRVEVTVAGMIHPVTGMVVDFARVKEIIGGWIDREWDHKTILNAQDPMLLLTFPFPGGGAVKFDDTELTRRYGHVPFTLPAEPTAENMAKFLAVKDWFKDHPGLRGAVRVTAVTVHETDSCSATCTME